MWRASTDPSKMVIKMKKERGGVSNESKIENGKINMTPPNRHSLPFVALLALTTSPESGQFNFVSL